MKRIAAALLLTFALPLAAQSALAPVQAVSPSAQPAKRLRIALVGDSTQTDNAGYGRGFCANLTATVECLNLAHGGASTHTYRDDGLWDHALAAKPDYMLIQFGHNDEPSPAHLARETPLPLYKENLSRFVTEARAANITPVFVTPLTRRYFGPDGIIHSDLTEYCNAMKQVAAETKTPLIDLQSASIDYLNKIGPERGTALGITKKDDAGKTIPDATHLNWQGSYIFGRMVAVGLGWTVPALKPYILSAAAPLPPEGVKAMAVLRGANTKIVLVGDSTVSVGGGWGPDFCTLLTPNVTCINDARSGRSSKSFIDEGLWAKALADHGDYYLIQFGHNDQPGKGPARETDPNTTYAANIRRYIADVRAIGGVPIIVTSLSRRTYRDGKIVEDLKEYADAARRTALEEHATVVDLNALSTKLLNTMTQEQADQFDAVGHADAKAENSGKANPQLDRTHLNAYGQKVFSRMVADALVREQVELGPDIIGEPRISAPSASTDTTLTVAH